MPFVDRLRGRLGGDWSTVQRRTSSASRTRCVVDAERPERREGPSDDKANFSGTQWELNGAGRRASIAAAGLLHRRLISARDHEHRGREPRRGFKATRCRSSCPSSGFTLDRPVDGRAHARSRRLRAERAGDRGHQRVETSAELLADGARANLDDNWRVLLGAASAARSSCSRCFHGTRFFGIRGRCARARWRTSSPGSVAGQTSLGHTRDPAGRGRARRAWRPCAAIRSRSSPGDSVREREPRKYRYHVRSGCAHRRPLADALARAIPGRARRQLPVCPTGTSVLASRSATGARCSNQSDRVLGESNDAARVDRRWASRSIVRRQLRGPPRLRLGAPRTCRSAQVNAGRHRAALLGDDAVLAIEATREANAVQLLRHLMVSVLTALIAVGPAQSRSRDRTRTGGNGKGTGSPRLTQLWVVNRAERAIIKYSTFDIAHGEAVPLRGRGRRGGLIRVLNRIDARAPTQDQRRHHRSRAARNFMIYIVNPAGVFFGLGLADQRRGPAGRPAGISDKDFVARHRPLHEPEGQGRERRRDRDRPERGWPVGLSRTSHRHQRRSRLVGAQVRPTRRRHQRRTAGS